MFACRLIPVNRQIRSTNEAQRTFFDKDFKFQGVISWWLFGPNRRSFASFLQIDETMDNLCYIYIASYACRDVLCEGAISVTFLM